MVNKGDPLGTHVRTRGPIAGVSRMRLALEDDADRMSLFLWWAADRWHRGAKFLVVANTWIDGAGSCLEDRYLENRRR